MAITICFLIITLNVNGLNSPIKWHRLAEWIKTQDLHICYLQDIHFQSKDIHRLKVTGLKNYFMQMGIKEVVVAILISHKINFKTRTVIREK